MDSAFPATAFDLKPGFNPNEQAFTVLFPDQHTTHNLSLHSVEVLKDTTVVTAIIFGIQIGMSLLLLTVLAVMTKPDKRRSIVFFLNLAALLLLFVRSIIMCAALQGPFYTYYNWALQYYPGNADFNRAIRVAVAGEVTNFLVIVAIELSLLFQVRIVCCTLKTSWRLAMTATTTLVATAVCGIRFATMVINARIGLVKVAAKTSYERALISNMASATNISVICSIIFFSAIFCAKLGHAIWQRRSIGMKQFGPMQIIFVMGCQTMFIPGESRKLFCPQAPANIFPVIFGILTYFVVQFSQLYSLMPMIVATFLPLSSMWASTNTKKDNIAAPHHVKRNRAVVVSPTSKTGGSSSNYFSEKELLGDSTLIGDVETPTKPRHDSADRDSLDYEIQETSGYGRQIQVDRTYTVRSD